MVKAASDASSSSSLHSPFPYFLLPPSAAIPELKTAAVRMAGKRPTAYEGGGRPPAAGAGAGGGGWGVVLGGGGGGC